MPYGVGAPLLEGLSHDDELELVREKPVLLIERLRAGELDAALASSIEGFRRPGYFFADHICIASRGPARSVRAFRRSLPIRTVGLDDGSATTVALLEILLRAGQLGPIHPQLSWTRIPPTRQPDELPFDLVMLIGDAGLEADPGTRAVIDLGEAWNTWTGLPFVFACWLIRPEIGEAAARRLATRLQTARQDAIRAQVDDGTDGAIYYDLRREEREGLARFGEEARRLGLAEEGCSPRFVG